MQMLFVIVEVHNVGATLSVNTCCLWCFMWILIDIIVIDLIDIISDLYTYKSDLYTYKSDYMDWWHLYPIITILLTVVFYITYNFLRCKGSWGLQMRDQNLQTTQHLIHLFFFFVLHMYMYMHLHTSVRPPLRHQLWMRFVTPSGKPIQEMFKKPFFLRLLKAI